MAINDKKISKNIQISKTEHNFVFTDGFVNCNNCNPTVNACALNMHLYKFKLTFNFKLINIIELKLNHIQLDFKKRHLCVSPIVRCIK